MSPSFAASLALKLDASGQGVSTSVTVDARGQVCCGFSMVLCKRNYHKTVTKAQFENTKQLQEKLIRACNVLDKHTIRTALGKHRPNQRMCALS